MEQLSDDLKLCTQPSEITPMQGELRQAEKRLKVPKATLRRFKHWIEARALWRDHLPAALFHARLFHLSYPIPRGLVALVQSPEVEWREPGSFALAIGEVGGSNAGFGPFLGL
jgi:hypothetical protein